MPHILGCFLAVSIHGEKGKASGETNKTSGEKGKEVISFFLEI